MLEHQQNILDTILSVVRTQYTDDIAVMLLYGSAVNGTAHEKSDLDLLLVPKTEKGWRIGKTFILAGIGYDIWTTPWQTLEAFARNEDMRTAILVDSVLVYYAAEEDRERYELLKSTPANRHPLTAHDDRPVMDFISLAEQYYAKLCLTGKPAFIGGIVMELTNALCRLNRTYLRYGAKKILEEAAQFEMLPPDFIENARCAMLYPESAPEVCKELICSTEVFIREQFASFLHDDAPAGSIAGLYEEISSHWNKIRFACAHDDAPAAFLAAAFLQEELDDAAHRLGLTQPFDLFEGYDSGSLSAFAAHCDTVQTAFVSVLREAGVPITIFENTDMLKEALIAASNDENI